MERSSDWNGMILHLFRQVDSSVHSSNTIKELTDGNIHSYTAFGNYDRLCFTPVYRFVDYMKRSENAYRWIGGHKDIMLYPVIRSSTERRFSFAQIGSNKMDLTMAPNYERRFLIMTMLFISSEVKEKLTDYQALLERCAKYVGGMIEKFNSAAGYQEEESVFGEVYGTFNSAEMCILWGANQFTDVQYLVDQIRYLSISEQEKGTIPLFASSYTIISLYQSISDILKKGPVKGGTMIQLASASLRDTTVGAKETPIQYLNDLKGEKYDPDHDLYDVMPCSGEYDFILNTRPPRLDLFDKSTDPECKNLYYKNERYKAHFSSTTTRLYYDEQDIPDGIKAVDWTACRELNGTGILENGGVSRGGDVLKPDKLLEEFDKYEKWLTENISDVSSMGTNLRLFRSDYMRALYTTPDRQWTRDLEYQVKTAIEALQAVAVDGSNENLLQVDRRYIEWSEMILQSLRHQIYHITEAGKFTFEEPSLRANSTVEFDLLFHMFYGAAKEILSCLYDRSGGAAPSRQSPLVPVIQFQPTPIIESALWFENDRVDCRLLDITIPYDAWGEPQFFIPYLVHEFYHYAAPMDRDVRNEYFSKFLLCEIYRNTIQAYLFSAYEPYCKAKNKGNQNLSEMDLERLIIEFSDLLCEEMFKIIGKSDVSIRDKMIRDCNGIDTEQEMRLCIIEDGDANWNIYKEAFIFWSSCLSGETDDENNCAGFLRKVIEQSIRALQQKPLLDNTEIFCDMLLWAIGSKENKDNLQVAEELVEHTVVTTENVLVLLEKALEMLRSDPGTDASVVKKCTSDNHFEEEPYPIAVELSDRLRKESEISLHQSIRGLREIFPDLAMVTLCDLDVQKYLLLFSVFQSKCFTTPAMYHKDDVSMLRVGCILDYLLKKEDPNVVTLPPFERVNTFRNYRKSFNRLYSGYCRCCGWSDLGELQTGDNSAELEKTAETWFGVFEDQLSEYYARYGVYSVLFERIVNECFAPLCSKNIGEKLGQISKAYFDALVSGETNQLFTNSLEAISILQPQKNLYAMAPNETTPNPPKTKPAFTGVAEISPITTDQDYKRRNVIRWVVNAENMQEILHSIAEDLQYTHRKCFNAKLGTNGLWYRGIMNSEYGILPSAMVHFLDKETRPENSDGWVPGKNSAGMLWEYQYRLLQQFKYQADGAEEMINGASYKMPDYLALMQHYEQRTCYLDWSEDAFSSLYFALEHYVTQDPKRNEESGYHASLFVLDPMLYNRARSMMVGQVLNEGSNPDSELNKQNKKLTVEPEGSVIDISLKWNLNKYSMFTMEDPNCFQEMKSMPAFVESGKPVGRKKDNHVTLKDFEKEVLNLPLAVHTSRLNPRIRKQSGQFMVYSYMCRPAYTCGEKEDPENYVSSADRFDYLALQQVQNYFLDKFPNDDPFMYELRIHSRAKESLAAYLRSAGINRFGIYPELENLKL